MEFYQASVLDRYGKHADIFHRYETTIHAGNNYRSQILDPFIAGIPENGGGVLDLASGAGEITRYLSERFPVVAFDLSAEALKLTSLKFTGKEKRPFLVRGIAQNLPFQKEQFQAVHAKDILVHLENHSEFFAGIKRVLAPDGKVLLVTQIIMEKPYFLIHIASGEAEKVYFDTTADYIKKIILLEKDQEIRWVTPPYFPVQPQVLINSVYSSGLKIDKLLKWQPTADEPDWHSEPEDRLVAVITRKSGIEKFISDLFGEK
ncbi:MAG: hypothetical protein UV73_C0006G0028 [Candidatus Gottesmanbacteria bacterium GW2011_GWA2_43_14]|uniref:Methyltransferase type 11 domain-containing protein n=1 Tax=Candidatus Gottesmanbacteria bacterium GW2011_GWA2_43_14 TaxID=1618443 RepID=A0A0G1DJ29_9BACT|nr:MAG: hypothetical protein UV73_C0006G0028 [Candidatus Gottesmanbacteria bacterium GW2011_GWA2_43_14]